MLINLGRIIVDIPMREWENPVTIVQSSLVIQTGTLKRTKIFVIEQYDACSFVPLYPR